MKRALHLLFALAVFTILFYWIGGIGNLSIHRPLHYVGDSLEVLAKTQNTISNDYNSRLRAPFEVSQPENTLYVSRALFDSKSNLKWISRLLGGKGTVKTTNLAYLISFLFIFMSGYWVCGRLGLGNPFRFGAASLFSLMPYHFLNSTGHFGESCYYFIPFLVLAIIKLWSARPLACRWSGEGWRFTWRDQRIWYVLFMLLFLTPFNPYHQLFFACLAAAVAPFAAAYRRNWRPWLVGWGLAIFACVALVLKHALAQHAASSELALGVNNQPISAYGSAEMYPLKLVQLLLPVRDHRWDVLASLRNMYHVANPMNNENSITTLGFVGAIGFLACVVLALIPSVKWRMSRAGKMGMIALMAVLFGVMGGFSSIISTAAMELLGPRSQLVQARAWDRIAIFIGFVAYFTAFWLMQLLSRSLAPRVERGWKRLIPVWMVGVTVLAFGLWDGVPYKVSQQHAGHYHSDMQFFGALQASLPPGARVFQLPFVVHHYSGFVRPGAYYTQMLRPYIASRDLHFTYGGDRLSTQSEWLHAASALPVDQAARYLCQYGFAGVLIQRNMLKDPTVLQAKWQAVLGEVPKISRDHDYAFFDLQSYCNVNAFQPLDLKPIKAKFLKQLHQGRKFLPGGAFSHKIGHVDLLPDGNIVIKAPMAKAGYVAYGPYATLVPGRYLAIFRFSSVSSNQLQGSLTLDVTASKFKKSRTMAHLKFQPQLDSNVVEKELPFVVGRHDSHIQYRVNKTRGVGFDFVGVEIKRVPN